MNSSSVLFPIFALDYATPTKLHKNITKHLKLNPIRGSESNREDVAKETSVQSEVGGWEEKWSRNQTESFQTSSSSQFHSKGFGEVLHLFFLDGFCLAQKSGRCNGEIQEMYKRKMMISVPSITCHK